MQNILLRKYLIFSRGNIDYSLYDIEKNEVIVNEHSAWGAAVAKPDIDLTTIQLNHHMNKWAFENLHMKINHYIKQ